MTKVIKNGKIYNIDKAEKIASYIGVRDMNVYNVLIGKFRRAVRRNADLYKTEKGNYFEYIHAYEGIGEEVVPISKERAREILKNINDIEAYEKEFGELEEA